MNTPTILSHRKDEPERSVLYLVGTPIGNLNDISYRAINILKKVSLIACEDTRKTGMLLKHYNFSNNLISFHKHNSAKKLEILIQKLKNKESIALVSDAGMPLISDPGELLVKKAKENNIDVITIPGPCAALAGLVCSGLDSSRFSFYGFIPKTTNERKLILKEISESKITSIVYESPKRIIKLLYDLKRLCGGNRNIVLLKEITKRYEKHFGNHIDNVLKKVESTHPKGEFTLIISGNPNVEKENEFNNEKLKLELLDLIDAGLSHSGASNYLSKKSGKTKNEIYKLIIEKDI